MCGTGQFLVRCRRQALGAWEERILFNACIGLGCSVFVGLGWTPLRGGAARVPPSINPDSLSHRTSTFIPSNRLLSFHDQFYSSNIMVRACPCFPFPPERSHTLACSSLDSIKHVHVTTNTYPH